MCIMYIHVQKKTKPSGSFDSFKNIYWNDNYTTSKRHKYISIYPKLLAATSHQKVMKINVTQVHAELHTFAPKKS